MDNRHEHHDGPDSVQTIQLNQLLGHLKNKNKSSTRLHTHIPRSNQTKYTGPFSQKEEKICLLAT